MEVASLECKLAQVQLQRYLEGGPMSPEAVRALEEHLTSCPSCRATLAAETPSPKPAPIPETPVTHAVVETPAPTAEAPKTPWIRALVDRIPGRFRTLTLSIALAACLVAMSTFAKDPTQLLGPRASALPEKVVASEVVENPKLHSAIELERKALTESPAAKAAAAQPAASKPPAATPTPPKPESAPVKPTANKPAAVTPKARSVRRPAPRRVASTPRRAPQRRATAPAPAPRRSSGIAVYDANGNRIR